MSYGTTQCGNGCHLLTTRLPKPRLALGRMVPLGQLGHEAKAASSGRTPVSGHSRC